MINDCTIDFNIQYNDNIKYSEEYKNYIDSMDLSSCSCPWCKAVGRFKKETIYERYFINSTDEINDPDILGIHVFKCEICGHFHAFLPAFICPFSSYSYPFITEALYQYYHGEYKGNCSRVSSMMGITRQLLSRWIRKFESSEMEIRMITAGKQRKAIFGEPYEMDADDTVTEYTWRDQNYDHIFEVDVYSSDGIWQIAEYKYVNFSF